MKKPWFGAHLKSLKVTTGVKAGHQRGFTASTAMYNPSV